MAWFDTLASAVLLGLGLLHLVRLTTAGRDGRSRAGEVSHAAMGFGMAVMFSPAIDPLPLPVWLVLFGLGATWFTGSALRDGLAGDNAGHHIVCSLSMLFMLFLGPHHSMEVAGGEHTAHTGPHTSAATASLWTSLAAIVLVGYFAWHGMRCGDRWSAARLERTDSPRLTGTGVTGGDDVAVRKADCAQGRPVNGGNLSALRTPRTAAIAHLLTSASMATMLLGAI
jgi:hypothetical protein